MTTINIFLLIKEAHWDCLLVCGKSILYQFEEGFRKFRKTESKEIKSLILLPLRHDYFSCIGLSPYLEHICPYIFNIYY